MFDCSRWGLQNDSLPQNDGPSIIRHENYNQTPSFDYSFLGEPWYICWCCLIAVVANVVAGKLLLLIELLLA